MRPSMKSPSAPSALNGAGGYLVALAVGPGVLLFGFGAVGPQALLVLGLLSYVSHSVIAAFLPTGRRQGLVQNMALSLLGLSVVLVLEELRARGMSLAEGRASDIRIASAWAGGGIVAAVVSVLSQGPSVGASDTRARVGRVVGFCLGLGVVTAAVWFTRGYLSGQGAKLPPLADLLVASTLATLALAASGSGIRAAQMSGKIRPRQRRLVALFAFTLVLGLAYLADIVPDAAFLGQGSSGVMLLLVAALAFSMSGGAFADFAGALLVMAALALPSVLTQGQIGWLLALSGTAGAMLIAASFLPARDRQANARQLANQPSASVFSTMQSRLGVFVLRLDFEGQVAHFPFGGGDFFGADTQLPLSDFFRLAPMAEVLDLMQRFQRGQSPQGVQIRCRLKEAMPSGERPEWSGQSFELTVLENSYPDVWIGLERQSELSHQLEVQGHEFNRLLSASVTREERLLMLVGHDLSAPAAALRDLGIALNEGAPWEDVAPAFRLTMKVLLDSIEDMRAGAGMADGAMAHGIYTVGQIADQIVDAFRPQAEKEGVRLRVSLPQQGEVPLRGEYGRVQVALARLVDNAFRHSKGDDIQLSVFFTDTPNGDVSVSWHVVDNGRGVDERRIPDLFEPLTVSALRPGARPSLGLFAARRSLMQIGGDIRLQPEPEGAHFVLTHPARLAPQDALPLDQTFDGEPDPNLLWRRIHYLDPKQSIDLPVAALLRIVGRVDRSSSLAETMQKLDQSRPDLVILSPDLSPAERAEAAKALLQSPRNVPILIAVPPSDLASAHGLEGARVRVMEVPISQQKLRRLTKELIAPALQVAL